MYALADAPALWTVPEVPELPEPVRGKRVLITACVYAGAPEEGERVMQPVRQLGTPIFDMSGPMPYRVVQSAFDFVYPRTGEMKSYWKSLYVPELSDAVIDTLVAAAQERPSELSLINIPHIGGAVRRVPPDATAFVPRDMPFMVSLDANWRRPEEADANIAWARETWGRLVPHSDGTVYLNFLGEEERDADTLVRAAFGPNYDRLVAVKTAYDPRNMFRLNQNIRPRT